MEYSLDKVLCGGGNTDIVSLKHYCPSVLLRNLRDSINIFEIIICRLPSSKFSLLAQTAQDVARAYTQMHSHSIKTEAFYSITICSY